MSVHIEPGEERRSIEVELATGTSAIERDLRHLRRADVGHTIAVVGLLIASAILLTVGLAGLSPAAWFGGVGTLLAAFVVDHVVLRWRDRELTALLVEADTTR